MEGYIKQRSHLPDRHASASMAQLAQYLTGRMDRPVLSMTGLKGLYDITLDWTRDENSRVPESKAAGGAASEVAAAPSIFMAVREQLGLKLERRKGPVEILVIDHVEKVPTAN